MENKIKLMDWVQTIPEGRNKDMLLKRLHGETLEEIAQSYGVTRERIRQIHKKLWNVRPELEEDSYTDIIYWFENYAFLRCDQFIKLFGISEEVYYYYNVMHHRKDRTGLKELKDDPRCTPELYDAVVELCPESSEYKDKHWHDYIVKFYQNVFDSNPHDHFNVIDVTRHPMGDTGKRFQTYFVCRCSCGNIFEVTTNNLSKTRSCGCYRKSMPEWALRTKYRSVRNVDTGKVYESIKAAGIDTGITRTSICYACSGKLKTAGGYHWEYVGETTSTSDAVLCVETGEVFPSISAANRAYPNIAIEGVLHGRCILAGGYHWEYVDKSKNGAIRKEYKTAKRGSIYG